MKEGWKEVRLDQLGLIYNGNSIAAKIKRENYTGIKVGVPYIGTKDVGFDHTIDYENGVKIPQNAAASFREAPVNSVLICAEGGSAGRKIAHNSRKIFFGNKLYAVVPNDQTCGRYVFYYCISSMFYDAFTELKRGLIGGVSSKKLKSICIPLPPLSEQERIVSILDEAFAAIDTATTNAEKNLANARELFESCLESIFDPFLSCSKKPLAKLCFTDRVITYGVIKLGEVDPAGIQCLRTSNVRRLSIDTAGIKKISPHLSQDFQRTILQGGEVLVNVRGTLGGVAVVPLSMAGWNVSREVAVVPVDPNLINPEYLALCIATKSCQDWLTGVVKGLAYRGINIGDLRELPIPVPSTKKQGESVLKVHKYKSSSESIITHYQSKIDNLEKLKQSILHKAFTGELTADPASIDRALSEVL